MKSARAIGFATSRHLPHLLGYDLLVDAALDMWLTAGRILSDMAERPDEYFLVSGRKFTLRELVTVIEEEKRQNAEHLLGRKILQSRGDHGPLHRWSGSSRLVAQGDLEEGVRDLLQPSRW